MTAKPELRALLRARRRDAARAGTVAAEALAARALGWFAARGIDPAATVAGYVAAGSEIDPALLLAGLAERGHALCLPVVAAADQPLLFRGFRPGDALEPGRLGIAEPRSAAPIVTPAIVLTPLVGFDRRGGRLGQGGGFYDRTLAALRHDNPRLLAIGLAFSVQEVASVPRASTDAAVDLVITERAVIEDL